MRGRTKLRTLLVAAMATIAGAAEASSGRGAEKHAAISAYEGTRTCAACHAQQVKDVATSLHYQQQGTAPFLANAQQAKSAGMMVSY
jgi:hypothetical protein